MTAAKRSTSCSFLQWRGIRQDEHFTFDWKRVPDSLEKEKEKYAIYTEIIGDAKFSDEDVNIRDIEYTASKEPSEWFHVQHLIDVCAPRQISGECSKELDDAILGFSQTPIRLISIISSSFSL